MEGKGDNKKWNSIKNIRSPGYCDIREGVTLRRLLLRSLECRYKLNNIQQDKMAFRVTKPQVLKQGYMGSRLDKSKLVV